MLLQTYVIPLDTKTKKNSHRIAGCGPRCPMCGKFQKQFIRNGKATTDFAFRAAQYLRPRPEKPYGLGRRYWAARKENTIETAIPLSWIRRPKNSWKKRTRRAARAF